MGLELNSLKKAVEAMAGVLAKSSDTQFMQGLDEVAQNAVKSGVIQHFEFTYELCWKFMKRWLDMNVGPAVAEGVTRRELFRLAAENRLIADVDEWMRYHDARNQTAHTYDPEIAQRIYALAYEFSHDARRLLDVLAARND